MRPITLIVMLTSLGAAMLSPTAIADNLVWPPPPDQARLEYVGEINCRDLTPEGGFLSKVGRWIGGRSERDRLSLPFDVLAEGHTLFIVCQNIPALVEIDRIDGSFRLHQCKKTPLSYPVSLCSGGTGLVFVTDSDAGSVYKFENDRIEPFITSGLKRPTGVAAMPDSGKLFIVDTGEHNLKVYDYTANLLTVITGSDEEGAPLNFPTFAVTTADNHVLVNDALNYQIKRFNSEGLLIGTFGEEGDGPGTFARPKGIAVDSDANVYVVDNLFDNLQIFDGSGRLLLVVGSAGQGRGQFWSPTGIDVACDTVFIADTHNNRIQILRYLREEP